jgi:signal transduction histidine kinase
MNRDKTPFQDKERLFDLLIHDLRSPLAVVATSVHNLIHRGERYGPLNEKQNQVMQRIARNVQKSQFLIQEMIEILRSEEGIFQREYFYLEPALREALLDPAEVNYVNEFLRSEGAG